MIQVIKYRCCGKIFAACVEPECYLDTDWLKDIRHYAKRGDKIEMIESNIQIKFEKCECNKLPKTKEPDLFSEILSDNQLI